MAIQTTTIRAAAAQLRATRLDHAADALADIHGAIDRAADDGAELVVLPECAYPAYYVGSVETYRSADVIDNDALFSELSSHAKRRAVHVVCGFIEDRGAALSNAAVMVDDRGEVLGVHRKTFMWGDDNDIFVPGERVAPVETRWGRIGMVICADARAPETVAALAAQGAELICVPTCWVNLARARGAFYNPQPDFLIAARAGEFAVPFVCANKIGIETPDLSYCGQSLIVDHTGRVLAEAPSDEPALLQSAVALNQPAAPVLPAEVRDRLESDEPPVAPDAGPMGEITVAAVPGRCLATWTDDADGRDLLQSLAAIGADVVATSLPDEETGERLGIYARALGLRLIGWALRDRVVADAFGTYACVRGAQLATYAIARARALDGAAILFATDMPADPAVLRARAAENRVYVVGTADSAAVIIAPDGAVLAVCDSADPKPLTVPVDLRRALDKLVFAGTDIWAQRRVHACRAAFAPARAATQ